MTPKVIHGPFKFIPQTSPGVISNLQIRVCHLTDKTQPLSGDEFEVPMDHFWGQKPLRNDFSRAFPRFGQITHLSWRVGNDTWTGVGDEFEVPMDLFLGPKPLQNDFSKAFSESG